MSNYLNILALYKAWFREHHQDKNYQLKKLCCMPALELTNQSRMSDCTLPSLTTQATYHLKVIINIPHLLSRKLDGIYFYSMFRIERVISLDLYILRLPYTSAFNQEIGKGRMLKSLDLIK